MTPVKKFFVSEGWALVTLGFGWINLFAFVAGMVLFRNFERTELALRILPMIMLGAAVTASVVLAVRLWRWAGSFQGQCILTAVIVFAGFLMMSSLIHIMKTPVWIAKIHFQVPATILIVVSIILGVVIVKKRPRNHTRINT